MIFEVFWSLLTSFYQHCNHKSWTIFNIFFLFLEITALSKIKYIGGPENSKNLILMNPFFLDLNRLNSCMVYSQRLLWWKMNSAILHLIHVQNLILFLVCLIVPEPIFKDRMIPVITLTVTNDKVKIVSLSITQHAIEDVLDFRNCVT